MLVLAIVEHLQRLERRLLEQPHRGGVLVVRVLQRGRRVERAKPAPHRPESGQGALDPSLELCSIDIIRFVEDLPEAHPYCAALDVAMDRPQRVDVRFLSASEWWSCRRDRGGCRRGSVDSFGFVKDAMRHNTDSECRNAEENADRKSDDTRHSVLSGAARATYTAPTDEMEWAQHYCGGGDRSHRGYRAARARGAAIRLPYYSAVVTMPFVSDLVALTYTWWENHFSKTEGENCFALTKTACAFLLAACAFLLVMLGASAATSDGWTTYRTERGGFSVEHPSAWTVQEDTDARGALVTTFTSPAGAGVAVIVEPRASSAPDNDDVMNTRCREVTISGRPGTTCFDTISSSLSTTVVSDGKTYRIMSSRRRSDPKIYDHIVASFHILP